MIARMDAGADPALGRAVRRAVFRDAMTDGSAKTSSRVWWPAPPRVSANGHAWLSELDSRRGDGDHGATMLRCVDRLEKAVGAGSARGLESRAPRCRLERARRGWRRIELAARHVLPGMADAPAGTGSLDCRGLAAAFEAGLAAVRKQTKAQPGDKTMMDALVPAVEAFARRRRSGETWCDALSKCGRSAARAGAEATSNITARYGRAKFLGEKTRGHQDPGRRPRSRSCSKDSGAGSPERKETGNA